MKDLPQSIRQKIVELSTGETPHEECSVLGLKRHGVWLVLPFHIQVVPASILLLTLASLA